MTHVAQKESHQRDKLIMRKLDLPFSSGSEREITPEAEWIAKHRFQWAASQEDTNDGSDEEYRDEEDTD